MPCNSSILVTVEMGANVDVGLLHEGLKKIGAVPIRLEDGSLAFQIEGTAGVYSKTTRSLSLRLGPWGMKDRLVNKIKAAYSYEVVMSALRRTGGTSTVKQDGERQVINVRLAGGR